MIRQESELKLKILARGTAWMDCGTVESLNDACNYIRVIEERQGYKIGALEEVAWRNQWITSSELLQLVSSYQKSEYAEYLRRLIAQY